MKRIIIAAVDESGVIGKENKLPWSVPDELRFFKKTTTGFPVLMGRKTFESIGKTLDGRLNIVLSKTLNKSDVNEALLFPDVQSAEKYLSKLGTEKIFIIGGASLFRQFMDSADEMIISRIKGRFDGDVYFPELKKEEWKLSDEKRFEDFTVHFFIRTAKSSDNH